jgi:membrane-associated phospholipid phosphatase
MMSMWEHITDLADVTTMGLVAAVIVVGLVAEGAWRTLFYWGVLLTIGMLLVAISKIAFIGWGIGSRSLDFTGFSGHAMRATAIIPTLFYLLLRRASPAIRFAGVLLGLAFGVVVAVSRLALHAHSMSEAVTGCILGAAISLGFIWIAGDAQKVNFNRSLIAISMIAVLAIPPTEPGETQRIIVDISLYLSGHQTPFVRDGWRFAPANSIIRDRK